MCQSDGGVAGAPYCGFIVRYANLSEREIATCRFVGAVR